LSKSFCFDFFLLDIDEEYDDDDDEDKLDPDCENLVLEQDLPVDLIRLIEDKNR